MVTCSLCLSVTVLVPVLYTLSYTDFDAADLPWDKVCRIPLYNRLCLLLEHISTQLRLPQWSAFSPRVDI